ncbi:hypothetical protein QP938_08630 [Porticoccaceae bacterium LTM1]|nr:hypothetical protein QP938_08630 [Porticoccaceae bacterium LTM1]
MKYSREQLIGAMRNAHEAGDKQAVVAIGRQLDKVEANSEQQGVAQKFPAVDIEYLKRMAVRAHNAGDTEAARQLYKQVKQQEAEQQQQSPAVDMQRLYDALRNAHAAGDTAAATRLAQYIREQTGKQEEYEQLKAQQQTYDARQTVIDDMGTGERFLVGIGKGMTDIGRGAQDLWYRMTGDDDALSELNKRSADEDAIFNQLSDQSFAASAGEVTGEIAATLPLGMGVGGAVGRLGVAASNGSRVAQVGSRLTSTPLRYAATEGAIVEGVTQRGDLGDRLGAAAQGAVFGAAGQKVVDTVGAGIRRFTKRADAEDLRSGYAAEDELAASRMSEANEYGGYSLDSADAYARHSGLAQKQDLIRGSDEAGMKLRQFQAQQEADIFTKAEGLAADTGGNYQTKTETAEAFAERLLAERDGDYRSVNEAYESWRSSGGDDVELDTRQLQDTVLNQLDKAPEAFKLAKGEVKEVLVKYGILPDPKARVSTTIGADGLARKVTPQDSSKRLTVRNAESAIQELNALWNRNASDGQNRMITQVKKTLDFFVDSELQRLDIGTDSAVTAGRQAREAKRSFHEKWDTGDVFDKLTSKRKGSDEYRMKPLEAVAYLTRPQNVETLEKVRRKLAFGSPEDARVWANIKQAPLLEALEAASKQTSRIAEGGQQLFDTAAFSRTINRLSPEVQENLWGKEGAAEIQKAIKAWSLRGKRVSLRGNDNPSGTAEAALRLFLRYGLGTAKGIAAVAPVTASVVKHMDERKALGEVDRLIDGKQTKAALTEQQEAISRELKELYKGTDMARLGSVLDYLWRGLFRETGMAVSDAVTR